jgi:hypothetical protein
MIFVKPAYAQCPVCIITVGGGLLLAKKLGIDDLLVSLWISGLNTAIAIWLASKVKRSPYNNWLSWSLFFYIITMIYLFFSKQIGHPKNILFGIDKVTVGMTVGLIVFLIAKRIDTLIRKNNNGKVKFQYQKVIIPVSLLILVTGLFYGIMKI